MRALSVMMFVLGLAAQEEEASMLQVDEYTKDAEYRNGKEALVAAKGQWGSSFTKERAAAKAKGQWLSSFTKERLRNEKRAERRNNKGAKRKHAQRIRLLISRIDTDMNSCLSLQEVLAAASGARSGEALELLTPGVPSLDDIDAFREEVGNDGFTQLIKLVVQLVDTNRNDCLSLSEFTAIDVVAISEMVTAASALSLVDANGDGCVSVQEVQDDGGLSEEARKLLTGGKISVDDIAAVGANLVPIIENLIFPMIDADPDQCLSLNEIANINYDAIFEIFSRLRPLSFVDANGDGCVSVEEVEDDGGLSEEARKLLTGGKVSVDDIAAVGANLVPIIEKQVFPMVDVDSNSCLSLNEIANIDYDAIFDIFSSLPPVLIRHLDTDKDGCLHVLEFLDAAVSKGALYEDAMKLITQGEVAVSFDELEGTRRQLDRESIGYFQQLVYILYRVVVDTDSNSCLSLKESTAIDVVAIRAVVIAATAKALLDTDNNHCLTVWEMLEGRRQALQPVQPWRSVFSSARGDRGRHNLGEAALVLLTGREGSLLDASLVIPTRDAVENQFSLVDADSSNCWSLFEIVDEMFPDVNVNSFRFR